MQIKICDICLSRERESVRKSYAYDRKMDAAGSMDDLWETYDLCMECECKVVVNVLTKESPDLFDRNKLLISEIKELQKKSRKG